MNNRIFLIVFSLLCLGNVNCLAQLGHGRPEHLKELQGRTVIVVLKTTDEEDLKSRFKNDEEKKKFYRVYVSEYNENIISVVETMWPYKKEFEYKNETQLKSIMKNKEWNSQFLYIYHQFNDDFYYKGRQGLAHDRGQMATATQVRTSYLSISLADKAFGKAVGLGYITTGDIEYPKKLDLIEGMKQVLDYFNRRVKMEIEGLNEELYREHVSKNANRLNKRILLLNQEILRGGLTEDKIKSAYPYPFKIVSCSEINSAIINFDSTYAYVNLNKPNDNFFNIPFSQEVVDAGDGSIIATYKTPPPKEECRQITEQTLRDYADRVRSAEGKK